MASVPLLVWYRADLGLTGVSPITGIGDQSGLSDPNRNQTVTNGTLNVTDATYGGKATIYDLQTTRAGTWTNTPAVPITIIVVGEITNVSNGAFLSDPDTGQDMLWKDPLFAKFFTLSGALFSNVDISTPSVTMFSDDGSGDADAAKIYVNDLTTPNNYDVTVFQPVNGLDIDRGVAGVSDFSGGKIAEIIIYKGILTTDDLTNLRVYLNVIRAYGIAVT